MSLYRQLGQLFMMGFDGTEVSDQVRILIENYHVGSILLTAKNLKCASPQIMRSFVDMLTLVLMCEQLPLKLPNLYSTCRH